MIPNVQRLVASAIRNRRRILLRYDGRERSRVVEPHLLYYGADRTPTLVAYQVRGYHSSRRQGAYWRPFQLGKIDSIYVTEETFIPRQKQGYATVAQMVRGEVVSQVELVPSQYCYFNPTVYGPPTPAYLAATPSQMVRLAAAATRQ